MDEIDAPLVFPLEHLEIPHAASRLLDHFLPHSAVFDLVDMFEHRRLR